ncbi:MAG: hypothetical protein V4550_18445 [Gemmatimonadota bacterium]
MKTACCKGLDVLLGSSAQPGQGADDLIVDVGAAPGAGKTYLTMHINDPAGLVAKEKGEGVAWATGMLVPEFIENTIYSTVADELKKQFKEKGSEITVEITQTPPKGSKPTSDLAGGIFFGVLLSALGYGAVKLAGGR